MLMFKYSLVILSILFVYNSTWAQAPANLTLVKQNLVRYHDSGEYDHDINKSITKAETYLANKIVKNNKQKLAIVLDLDETSLSNYQLMQQDDFSSTHAAIIKRLKAPNHPAIPETLALYKFAEQHGVAVFFITGRGNDLRKFTDAELKRAGYTHWNQLFMHSTTDPDHSVIAYKSSVRKKITAMGYDIVLNVGDQYSDLAGGYADDQIKLPNPYYYVP